MAAVPMPACSVRSCFGCPAVVLQQNGMTVIFMNSIEGLQGLAPAQQAEDDVDHTPFCRQMLLQGLLALAQQLAEAQGDAEVVPNILGSPVPESTGDSRDPQVVYMTPTNWAKRSPAARYHVHRKCQPAHADKMIPLGLAEVVAAGIRECDHCIPLTRQRQPVVAATNPSLNLWKYAGVGVCAAACCAMALVPGAAWF